VPPCVLEATHCGLKSRMQAKVQHAQTFDSELKLGGSYFKSRGYSESFKKEGMQQFSLIKRNIEDVSPPPSRSPQSQSPKGEKEKAEEEKAAKQGKLKLAIKT